MAEHADGSIIVDTEIDSSGFKSGSAEMKSAVKSLTKQVAGLGPTLQKAVSGNTKAMGTFEAKASALKSKITDLEAQMAKLGNHRMPTEDYKFFSLELEKAKKHLEQLEAREAKMNATGVSQKSKAYKSLQYDIQLAKDKVMDLEATMAGMRQNGTAFKMGSATPEYQQMEASLAAAKQQMAEMDAATSAVKANASTLPTVGERVASAFAKAGAVIKSSVVSGLKMAASAAGKLLSNTLKAVTGMSKLGKSTGRTGRGFGSMIKSMLFFRAFSVVLQSIKTGIDGLAKSSTSFNQTMSQLKTSTSQLRNSLITAFAPILQVVIPILSTLISKLAQAITYIGQFIAALTGASTYTRAISKQEDYAAALDKTAGAAKEAKRQLAGFDELNVLSDSKSSGNDTGVQFEEVPIEESISGFAERIKEAFKNGEYYEIGQIIGEGLNVIVQKVYDVLTGIDWEGIGVAFGEGLNGFVNGVDWDLFGKTIGAYFMARLNVIYGVISTFDWAAAGRALGTAIMGLWTSIDWAKAGRALSTAVIGVLNFITEAIKTIDWQKVGNDVATFIANIDWSGMVAALFEGIGAALGGLTSFLWGLIEAAWDEMVKWWYDVAYEDGQFTIEGLLLGIGEALLNIGKWIVDNIFTPFINGFCEAFGIHSPSTVMQEQGGYLIDGLFLGISNAWTSITTFFGEALSSLTSLLSNGWETIKQGASTAWDKVSGTVSSAWNTVKQATTDASSKVKSSVSNAWENAKKDITSNLDKAKSSASKAWDAIKKAVSTTGNAITSDTSVTWSDVYAYVSNNLNSVKGFASSAWNSIKSTATTVNKNINSTLSSAWSSIKTDVSNSLNSVKSTASSAWNSIKSNVSSVNSSIQSNISSCWNNAASTIRSKLSSISSNMSSTFNTLKSNAYTWGKHIIENLVKGISDFVYKVVNAVKNVAQKIKDYLGFSEPDKGPLSNFHTYMPDMLDLMEQGIRDNEYKAVDAAAHMAKAISDEVQNGDYGTVDLYDGTVSGLNGFSDKIADSFAELMYRLQAIADRVTFAVPDVSKGAVPYSVSTAAQGGSHTAAGSADPNDDLSSVIIQSVNNATVAIVKAIQEYSQTNVNIDSDSLTDTIISEINRRTKMNGKSPLLT